MKLPFRVTHNTSTLADFAHESDAMTFAKHKAASTFQTPQIYFSVYDLRTKVGRSAGTEIAEFVSKLTTDYTGPK